MAVTTVNTLRAGEGKPPLTLDEMRKQQLLRYISFPEQLRGKYQSYTQADIGALRKTGYVEPFLTVEQGVSGYVTKLLSTS